MSVAELDDDAIWAWWCRNAAAYGVSPTIDDPALIAKVVTLALAADEGSGGHAPSPDKADPPAAAAAEGSRSGAARKAAGDAT